MLDGSLLDLTSAPIEGIISNVVMISYDCLELSAFFRSKVDDARAGLKHYAKNVVGKKCNTPFRHRKGGGWVRFQPFFE